MLKTRLKTIFLLLFSPFQDILRLLFFWQHFWPAPQKKNSTHYPHTKSQMYFGIYIQKTKLILLDSLLQEVWRTTGQVIGLRALHLLPASCIGSKRLLADERSESWPRRSLVQGRSLYCLVLALCLVRAPYFSQSSAKCAALRRGLDYSGKAWSINTFANHQTEVNIDSCIV